MHEAVGRRLSIRGTTFAVVALLTCALGLAFVAWAVVRSASVERPAGGERAPLDAASRKEQNAESCLRGARFAVEEKRWDEARFYLHDLRRRYADTAFAQRHEEQVDALLRAIEEGLDEAAADDEPSQPPRFFGGSVRRLSDGRVALHYEFEDASELRDWNVTAGPAARVADGRLEYGGPQASYVAHAAPFVGDIEIAGTYRILEALDPYCDCSVSFCNGAGRYYAVSLAPWEDKIFKGDGEKKADLFRNSVQRPVDADHTFQIVRTGGRIAVSVDGQPRGECSDAELTGGGVGLGAWCSRAAFLELRITGRLSPEWLQANPLAAQQLASAPADPAGK